MDVLCAQVCQADSAEAFDEVVGLLPTNYHPWTQSEFNQAFIAQETEQLKKNMISSNLPFVLCDVIVSYALPSMTALLKDVLAHMASTGVRYIPEEDVPQIVRNILGFPVHKRDAGFLALLCSTFGKVGLKLVLESMQDIPSGNYGNSVPLRTVLLCCMYEVGLVSVEACAGCQGFDKVQYVKKYGKYKM
jgi:hypothetical protein